MKNHGKFCAIGRCPKCDEPIFLSYEIACGKLPPEKCEKCGGKAKLFLKK
jgi:hypothetical protein